MLVPHSRRSTRRSSAEPASWSRCLPSKYYSPLDVLLPIARSQGFARSTLPSYRRCRNRTPRSAPVPYSLVTFPPEGWSVLVDVVDCCHDPQAIGGPFEPRSMFENSRRFSRRSPIRNRRTGSCSRTLSSAVGAAYVERNKRGDVELHERERSASSRPQRRGSHCGKCRCGRGKSFALRLTRENDCKRLLQVLTAIVPVRSVILPF